MHESGSALRRGRIIFALAFCLLPVLVFYGLLFREMRSVPMFDDYHAILAFVLQLKELPSIGARLLYVAAAQHDEYKLIIEHAIVAADWALTGCVHFGFLILLGNFLVCGLAWVLWNNTFVDQQDLSCRLLLFAPVCYLLFQLNSAENFDWAMCGLQTMPVLFFTAASMHFLVRDHKVALSLACACAVCACLSSVNGFLLAPIGLLILLWQRRMPAAVLWAFSTVLALALYLYRYAPFVEPTTVIDHGLARQAIFFLAFAGGAIENLHHFPVRNGSVVLGVLVLVSFVEACRTGFYRSNPLVFWMAVWCLLTAGVVAHVRTRQGLDLSLTGRYKIYSDLLLIAVYVFWIQRVRAALIKAQTKRLLYACVCVGVVLFAATADVFGYQFLAKRQRRVSEGFAQYAADPARTPPEISITGEPVAGPEPELTRVVLTEAIREGIYQLPPASAR